VRVRKLTKTEQMRFLIVDDSEDDRRWIARLIDESGLLAQDSGRVIEEAECLADATNLADAGGFDICIVDWELPDGTGVEFAQHLRSSGQHLPVIVITGNERPEQGILAVGRGAADFLPKSDLTPRALARACAHALARSQLEREIAALREAEVAATQREHQARLAAETSLVEERRARERVSALHALSSALGSTAATTTQSIVPIVVERVAQLEHSLAVSVHLLRDGALHLEAAFGLSEEQWVSWASIPLTEDVPMALAVRDSSTSHFGPVAPDRRHGVCIPLCSHQGPIGALTVCFAEPWLPHEDNVSYVELIAQHVAQALQRARLLEDALLAAEFEERLLTVVGHDLRTPLSAIAMATHLLQARDAHNDLVPRLLRSTQRMNDLISDVLDRAAVRRGIPSQRKAYASDLAELLRDQVDELCAALPAAQIRLEASDDVEVQCEPLRASQIISNLVRNAAQHGHQGTPITVRLATHPIGAEISVHNLGTPIPAKELPQLFDPFKRGRSAAGSGTGLGLFIVKETAVALGGEVRVTSDGSGTTFSVALPEWNARLRNERMPNDTFDNTDPS